jgi:hypothetical protein
MQGRGGGEHHHGTSPRSGERDLFVDGPLVSLYPIRQTSIAPKQLRSVAVPKTFLQDKAILLALNSIFQVKKMCNTATF